MIKKNIFIFKCHANKLSGNAITKLNIDNYMFHYKGNIKDLYFDYKIEKAFQKINLHKDEVNQNIT